MSDRRPYLLYHRCTLQGASAFIKPLFASMAIYKAMPRKHREEILSISFSDTSMSLLFQRNYTFFAGIEKSSWNLFIRLINSASHLQTNSFINAEEQRLPLKSADVCYKIIAVIFLSIAKTYFGCMGVRLKRRLLNHFILFAIYSM